MPEWENAAGAVGFQFFPGEWPSNGAGTLGGNGIKGPFVIPANYYSNPEIYGYPLAPSPWGYTAESRASLALYDYRQQQRPITPPRYEADDTAGTLVIIAPRTWLDSWLWGLGGIAAPGGDCNVTIQTANRKQGSGVWSTDTFTVTSCTLSAGAGLGVIVGIAFARGSGTATITGVTWNGTAMFEEGEAGTDGRTAIYSLANATPGTGSVVVTKSGTLEAGVDGISVDFIPLAGTDTADLMSDFASSANVLPSVNVLNVVTGDIVYDVVEAKGGAAWTPGAGQTEDFDITQSSSQAAGSRETGSGTITMSWTGNSAECSQSAGRIRCAAGAGGGGRPITLTILGVGA